VRIPFGGIHAPKQVYTINAIKEKYGEEDQ